MQPLLRVRDPQQEICWREGSCLGRRGLRTFRHCAPARAIRRWTAHRPAPGWPRLVPGTGQALAPAEPELERGCHLPTTPSPPRHLSGLPAAAALVAVGPPQGAPTAWCTLGTAVRTLCPGTAPSQPSPRSSISLARAVGAVSGLHLLRGTRAGVWDRRGCREDTSASAEQSTEEHDQTWGECLCPSRACCLFRDWCPMGRL